MEKRTRKNQRISALNNQIQRIKRKISWLEAKSNRFSTYRLVTFVSGVSLGMVMYYLIRQILGWSIIGITLIFFTILVYHHHRIINCLEQCRIWVKIKSSHLARMNLQWEKLIYQDSGKHDSNHPFALDLDIIGQHSLQQLIDTSVTNDGSHLLQQWLLQSKTDLQTVQERQTLIKKLAPLSRFRDRLLLTFHLVAKENLDSKQLLTWLNRQTIWHSVHWLLPLSLGLAVINIGLVIINILGIAPAYWTLSLTLYAIIYMLNMGNLRSLLYDADILSREFHTLKKVLLYLETYPYDNHKELTRLCEPFLSTQTRPSTQLKHLGWLEFLVGLRMNPILGILLNILIPWDFYVAKFLNGFKIRLQDYVQQWLNILAKLEALNSLANFAYLHPDYAFAEYVQMGEKKNSNPLQAEDLGHPLLTDKQRITNDFAVNKLGEIALITGSNMSGKSTFLKALGMNMCLAMTGAPVCARSFNTAIFSIYSCIKVTDSVTDGISFFYAEVRRLKSLLTKLRSIQDLPLLFLIDEIFKGTNNQERLIGSQSYIEALVNTYGIGGIATHDLELTKLEKHIPGIVNYHFREEIRNDTMVFDYRIRLGPCPTTNALKIMRMAGLPVKLDGNEG